MPKTSLSENKEDQNTLNVCMLQGWHKNNRIPVTVPPSKSPITTSNWNKLLILSSILLLTLHILGILPLKGLQMAEGETVNRVQLEYLKVAKKASQAVQFLLQDIFQVTQHASKKTGKGEDYEGPERSFCKLIVLIKTFSARFESVWRTKQVRGPCRTKSITLFAHGNW